MKSSQNIRIEGFDEKIGKVIKRLDIIAVVLLAESGLSRKEIAEILGVSEKTIERMLPFGKLSRSATVSTARSKTRKKAGLKLAEMENER
jgi:transposase